MNTRTLRLAVLLSGGGRTLANLQEHIAAGSLQASIDKVISSRSNAYAVTRAHALGLSTVVIERKTLSENKFQQRVTQAVEGVDLVCMAGFLSLWHIPDGFRHRVLNIHPALLPDFGGKGMYGRRVHEAVIASQRTESGCTVHLCDNQYDHGPIVLQRRVCVTPDDTPDRLADRVFEQECLAYPQAIQLFAQDRVRVDNDHVTILAAS